MIFSAVLFTTLLSLASFGNAAALNARDNAPANNAPGNNSPGNNTPANAHVGVCCPNVDKQNNPLGGSLYYDANGLPHCPFQAGDCQYDIVRWIRLWLVTRLML